jgi:hypothetical protein
VNKFAAIALLFLFSFFVSADFLVSPMSFNMTTANPSSLTQSFTLTNNNAFADSYTFAPTGQFAGWVNILNSNYQVITSPLTVLPTSSASFYIQAVVPSNQTVGNYNGAVIVTENSSSSTKTVSGVVTVSKWVFKSSSVYLQANDELQINYGGSVVYRIRVTSAGNPTVFDILDAKGTKIASHITLGVGDPAFELDDLSFKLIAVYGSSTVKAEIQSTVLDVTTSVQPAASVGTGGSLDFVKTKVMRNINRGETTELSLTLINQYSDAVKLSDLSIEGSSIYTLTADLKTLQPKEQLDFKLLVDATNAKTGDYTGSVDAIGYLPDSTKVTNSLPVTYTVLSTESTGNVSLGTPVLTVSKSNLAVGESLSISLTNVYETDLVSIDSDPVGYIATVFPTVNGNLYNAQINFNTAGKYVLTVRVKRQGLDIFSNSQTLFVGITGIKLNARVEPSLILGSASNIIIFDDNNVTVTGASVTVNGVASSGVITPTADTTSYTVCATLSPYAPTSPCPTFNLGSSEMRVEFVPRYPVENDQVAVKAFNTVGKELDIKVFIDGQEAKNPFIAPSPASYEFIVRATGYDDYNATIVVASAASKLDVSSGSVKQPVKITFDKPTNYAVYYRGADSSTPTYLDGGSNMVNGYFTPTQIGYYEIRSGSLSKTVFIDQPSWFDQNSLLVGIIAFVILVVLVLVVVLFMRRKKRQARYLTMNQPGVQKF